jgi:hypothetical protein
VTPVVPGIPVTPVVPGIPVTPVVPGIPVAPGGPVVPVPVKTGPVIPVGVKYRSNHHGVTPSPIFSNPVSYAIPGSPLCNTGFTETHSAVVPCFSRNV